MVEYWILFCELRFNLSTKSLIIHSGCRMNETTAKNIDFGFCVNFNLESYLILRSWFSIFWPNQSDFHWSLLRNIGSKHINNNFFFFLIDLIAFEDVHALSKIGLFLFCIKIYPYYLLYRTNEFKLYFYIYFVIGSFYWNENSRYNLVYSSNWIGILMPINRMTCW